MMAPVNTCLRRTFIVVDVVIGILGIIWLSLTLFLHGIHYGVYEGDDSDIHGVFFILHAFGVWVVLMCAVGLYGVLKKKQWALIVFSVGMILVCLVFLVTGLSAVISSYVPEEIARDGYIRDKPLNEESDAMQAKLESFQSMFHCCGITNGTHDWGNTVPQSCLCPAPLENSVHCIMMSRESNATEEVHVFGQSCFPYLYHIHSASLKIISAFIFASLLCVAVLPVLSIVILCQMRRKTIAPPVTFTTHASDSKYTELKYDSQI
ncbi:tetraspanin-8-like [Sardina pilchardus]|uniref:tetraspanin-8-like n=1 Tax=Sardina pilchardus TaxID=27697 RepID=UPI002E0D99B6